MCVAMCVAMCGKTKIERKCLINVILSTSAEITERESEVRSLSKIPISIY